MKHFLLGTFIDNVNRLYEAVTTLVQKVEEVNKRLMIIESTIVDSHKSASIDVNLIEMMLPFQEIADVIDFETSLTVNPEKFNQFVRE